MVCTTLVIDPSFASFPRHPALAHRSFLLVSLEVLFKPLNWWAWLHVARKIVALTEDLRGTVYMGKVWLAFSFTIIGKRSFWTPGTHQWSCWYSSFYCVHFLSKVVHGARISLAPWSSKFAARKILSRDTAWYMGKPFNWFKLNSENRPLGPS